MDMYCDHRQDGGGPKKDCSIPLNRFLLFAKVCSPGNPGKRRAPDHTMANLFMFLLRIGCGGLFARFFMSN